MLFQHSLVCFRWKNGFSYTKANWNLLYVVPWLLSFSILSSNGVDGTKRRRWFQAAWEQCAAVVQGFSCAVCSEARVAFWVLGLTAGLVFTQVLRNVPWRQGSKMASSCAVCTYTMVMFTNTTTGVFWITKVPSRYQCRSAVVGLQTVKFSHSFIVRGKQYMKTNLLYFPAVI